jgi:hypothetical protein
MLRGLPRQEKPTMDFVTISAGIAAAKTGLDTVKTAISLAKDAKNMLPSSDKKEEVGKALDDAARKLGEGEAAVAASLGYQLCRCEFPPTPMLQVGHIRLIGLNVWDRKAAMARAAKMGAGLVGSIAVHECPKCKRTDVPSYPEFERNA